MLLLAPLLKKWQTYAVLAAVGLALYIASLRHQLALANAALAARPAVHLETEQQVKTVRVAGPVHYETKTVYVPGTKEVQYVERAVTRDPVTTTTEKDSQVVKDVRPACPAAAAAPWRYVGLTTDGFGPPRAARAGVTLWNRLDAGASFDWKYHAAGVEAALRF